MGGEVSFEPSKTAGLRMPARDRARYQAAKWWFRVRRLLGGNLLGQNAGPTGFDARGRTLQGRYRVGERIGNTAVYAAEDLFRGVPVALKVLKDPGLVEPFLHERFAFEAAALRAAPHPGVVPVLDAWVSVPRGRLVW